MPVFRVLPYDETRPRIVPSNQKRDLFLPSIPLFFEALTYLHPIKTSEVSEVEVRPASAESEQEAHQIPSLPQAL